MHLSLLGCGCLRQLPIAQEAHLSADVNNVQEQQLANELAEIVAMVIDVRSSRAKTKQGGRRPRRVREPKRCAASMRRSLAALLRPCSSSRHAGVE